MIVGNKIDLRDGAFRSGNFVSGQEAFSEIKKLGCLFNECSALTRLNLVETFETAVREALKKRGHHETHTEAVEDSCPGCQLI